MNSMSPRPGRHEWVLDAVCAWFHWLLVLLVAAGAGCSPSSGEKDAGDARDAADAGDARDAGDSFVAGDTVDAGADRPADEDFDGWTLVFPQDLSFCGWNALERIAPPYAPFDHKLRITLRAATVRWTQGQERAEVELIEQVEVSPDGEAALPVGPGVLEVTVMTDSQQTWYRFDYVQQHQVGGRTLTASFGFVLRDPPAKGVFPVEEVLTPENNTCSLRQGQTGGRVEAEAVNGDRIVFDYRYVLSFSCPPGMACLTPYGLGDPERGEFTRRADQRTVDSYFRLGLACAHHGGPDRFLMIFDEPLGGIHGVTLMPDQMGGMDYQVAYLDEQLAVTATEPVTTITWDDPGHGG